MPVKLIQLARKTKLAGLVLLILAALTTNIGAQEVILKPDAPKRYEVQYGDSLWKIASIFLQDPWLWPQLWHNNPSIANPHLIYPGDVIELLNLQQGLQLQLKPRQKIITLQPALPYLSYTSIKTHLNQSRVVGRNGLEDGLYVMEIGQTNEPRTLASQGDYITAVGEVDPAVTTYAIFRNTQELRDPVNRRFLGNLAIALGEAQVKATSGRLTELQITASNQEIKEGDMLLPFVEDELTLGLQPYLSEEQVEGIILQNLDNHQHLANYQPVIINLGSEKVEPGLLLEVLEPGRRYRNPNNGEAVFANNKRKGLLLVYQTFEQTSLAIILENQRSLNPGDFLRPARSSQGY